MIPKPQNTEITPQWVTVKEELLDDFFDLANNLGNWKTKPTNTGLTEKLASSVIALYVKVRRKVKIKKEFEQLSRELDYFILNNINPTGNQLIKISLDLLDFIESTGITTVENEKGDPIKSFEMTAFPQ